jgi:hypothetical protein
LEIAKQPTGTWSRGRREPTNDPLQLVPTEAIEEKVCGNEIESLGGRRPVQNIGVDEFDMGCSSLLSCQLPAGLSEHLFTRIDANHLSTLKSAATLDQAASVAFAHQKNISSGWDFIQERGAATLQFLTRQDEFHPAVMRGQRIKAHGKERD